MTGPADMIELLSFNLGGEPFSIDVRRVRELRAWTRPTPLPHAPAYLCGVINLRGTIVPILDLAARLGLPPLAASTRNVIVIAEVSGQVAGLVVNDVSDIHQVPRAALETPPRLGPEAGTPPVTALSLIDDRMIRVIDLRAILPKAVTDAA